MARAVETEEPVIVKEREPVQVTNEPARSGVGTALVVLLIIIVLAALFLWRPWSSGGGSTVTPNVNVTAPSTTKNY